jgi:hypothetical protein
MASSCSGKYISQKDSIIKILQIVPEILFACQINYEYNSIIGVCQRSQKKSTDEEGCLYPINGFPLFWGHIN